MVWGTLTDKLLPTASSGDYFVYIKTLIIKKSLFHNAKLLADIKKTYS